MRINLYHIVTYGVTLALLISCANDTEWSKPIISTKEVTEITQSTAVSGGEIIDDSGLRISVRGVCWNTNPNRDPTVNDSKTDEGSGSDSFSSLITNLDPGTTYYVRAYAKNSIGVGYGSTISFTTLDEDDSLTDIDGNAYSTVTIDTFVWMVENLKVTKLNDGTPITLAEDNLAWIGLSTEGFCWYNNDQMGYGEKYGALYNWQSVSSGKLCPSGWRIPTNAEWNILVNYAGGEDIAGKRLKTKSGWVLDGNGTNDYGFSALPGGTRDGITGSFHEAEVSGFWWSSSENDEYYAWYRKITYKYDNIYRNLGAKESGFSVRCIRNK